MIECEEGESFNLQPSQTEIVGNLGTCYLHFASEGGKFCKIKPLTCDLHSLWLLPELNCNAGHSTAVREQLGVENPRLNSQVL